VLADPNRSMIKEGKLTKIAEKGGKKQDYTFFLFSDLILYADGGMQAKYKVTFTLSLSSHE
jgi:hypothetical protein